jgi:hypothetical protein
VSSVRSRVALVCAGTEEAHGKVDGEDVNSGGGSEGRYERSMRWVVGVEVVKTGCEGKSAERGSLSRCYDCQYVLPITFAPWCRVLPSQPPIQYPRTSTTRHAIREE